MSERCTAVHWFSLDPPGIGRQCVLDAGDHGMSVEDPHWDDEGRWWAVVTGFGPAKPERRPSVEGVGKSTPLFVRVTDDVLTVEIGVDTLASASLCSQYAWRCADEQTGRPGETRPDALFKVTDAGGLAEEVRAALLEESEDGSSLLTGLLDNACQKAIENGSQFWMGKDEEP